MLVAGISPTKLFEVYWPGPGVERSLRKVLSRVELPKQNEEVAGRTWFRLGTPYLFATGFFSVWFFRKKDSLVSIPIFVHGALSSL
jgi:hypothetical protein